MVILYPLQYDKIDGEAGFYQRVHLVVQGGKHEVQEQ